MALRLNPDDIEREECAVYVEARLSHDESEAYRSVGIEVYSEPWIPPLPGRHPLGFHLARVLYASLDGLVTDDRIRKVRSLERRLDLLNDLAAVVTNVDDVHVGIGPGATSAAPRTGWGVRLAVADSGLDVFHPDIPTPVEAYDVSDGSGVSGWGADVANTHASHGTHVTGIAVGNGSLSGGQYAGGAPGADLYFCKAGNDFTGYAAEFDVIEAIERAATVGCDVLTLSIGDWSQFLDGSECKEQAIDLAAQSGVTVFVPAGNEGGTGPDHVREHISALVAPGTTSPVIALRVENSDPADAFTAPIELQVNWIDDSPVDESVSLDCASCGTGESVGSGYYATSPRDTEGGAFILTPNVQPLQTKDCLLTITNGAVSGPTPRVHIYVPSGSHLGAQFPVGDPGVTVLSPAVADLAIAVGAYAHRTTWIDADGNSQSDTAETVGTLATFSSVGLGSTAFSSRRSSPPARGRSRYSTGSPARARVRTTSAAVASTPARRPSSTTTATRTGQRTTWRSGGRAWRRRWRLVWPP
jgi:hypothetical protein